ncbi:MAG: hypothetical protein WD555_05840 [Fulvivirga sp.]
MDAQKGLICKLTGNLAAFEETCEDFSKDEAEASYQEEKKAAVQEEKAVEVINRLDEKTLKRLRQTQDMLYAILGGFGAALVGAVLWAMITVVTNYQIGFIAIVVGLIAGFGVRYFGSGVDKIYGIIGAISAVLGCLLGNLFSQLWFLADFHSIGLITAFKLLDFSLLITIFTEGFSLIDLVFYTIAIGEGYNFAFRKLSPNELLRLKQSPDIIPYPAHHKSRRPLIIATFILLSVIFFSLRGGVNGMQTYYYENGAKSSEGELKDGVVDGPWTYYNENGSIMLTGSYEEGLETGKWVWYEDQKKVKEGYYTAGVPNGSWINYYMSGQLADSGHYQNGRLSGEWIFKHENGKIARKGLFKRDKPIGEWRSYYQNGQLMSLETFTDGQLSGQSSYWYDNGQPHQKVEYNDGNVKYLNYWNASGEVLVNNGSGKYQVHFNNGQLSETGRIINGVKVGTWKWFHDNGALRMEGVYDEQDILIINDFWDETGNKWVEDGNGKIHKSLLEDGTYENGKVVDGYRSGLWHRYSATGSLIAESYYKKGQLDGEFKAYFISELLNVEGNFYQNKETGLWQWYFENGQLESSINFTNGKKDGVQEFYNEAGIKVREEIYKNGELVEERLAEA